jgi:putative peptide zinc metalloprotease protein
LVWRHSLADPDRFLAWLAPKLGFVWTRGFLLVSSLGVCGALLTVIANRQEWAHAVARLDGEAVVVSGLLLLGMVALHELAHGLTCKHYGGEVHEIGFLWLYCLPCFYCNVSDAWLLPEKSKRLLVTLAGGYFDLCLWSLAVFTWRVTLPDTLINYFAWLALTTAGFRVFFNFNPFLKLDGYYLLSDWLEVPNLRSRSWNYVLARLRWLLWGAPRPRPEPRGGLLLAYGVAGWSVSLVLVMVMLVALSRLLASYGGLFGTLVVGVLGLPILHGLFRGVFGGEVRQMIFRRPWRTLMWLASLGAVAALLCLVKIDNRAYGTFEVRPILRAEVRAPVAGFMKAIRSEQGEIVSAGELVASLEIPELESRIAQQRAVLHEYEARLRLLKVGTREEELREQRRAVERARHWRDLAEADLEKNREAYGEEVEQHEFKIEQSQAELQLARDDLRRATALFKKQVYSAQEYEEAKKRNQVAAAAWEQAHACKRACEALGTIRAEEELARREKELADAEAELALLEAGTRPEEIEAEEARVARLQEEMKYLEEIQGKLSVRAPVAGIVVTPRLKEKAGQYLHQGALICEVEQISRLEIEIRVPEQEVPRVAPGQTVALKARALPYRTFQSTLGRVAPRADFGQNQSTVVIYCHLDDSSRELRPGMSGYARIHCGPAPLGRVLLDRLLSYVRTEFWW